MCRTVVGLVVLVGCVALVGGEAWAGVVYHANLDGLQETGPNLSPGMGMGTVELNGVMNQVKVNLIWSGLTGPAIAAHIHGPAAPGVPAGVVFPLSGVTNATAGSIPEQLFTISPPQVANLEAGRYYFNIHTGQFPSGEIRGQIVPEPMGIGMLVMGGAVLVGRRRRVA